MPAGQVALHYVVWTESEAEGALRAEIRGIGLGRRSPWARQGRI